MPCIYKAAQANCRFCPEIHVWRNYIKEIAEFRIHNTPPETHTLYKQIWLTVCHEQYVPSTYIYHILPYLSDQPFFTVPEI